MRTYTPVVNQQNMKMTYYEPVLTLTLVDPISQEWELKTEIFYPAQETGRQISDRVVGDTREIVVDVISDSSFQHDHLVTSTETYRKEVGEEQVEVTVEKDKKKKGQAVAVYTGVSSAAA